MARNRVQEKLDELIDDLALSVEEREYLYARRKSCRRARRVMNLLQEAIDCRSFRDRRHILDGLVPAMQELRAQMSAERTLVPEGFELVDAEVLALLREMAVAAIQMTADKSPTKRHNLFQRMGSLGRRLSNLDAEVGAEVGGGGDEGTDEGGEAP